MVAKSISWWIALSWLPLAASAQDTRRVAPVPANVLEIVTGPILEVSTAADRAAALALLRRARNSYALQSAGQGYDLKVRFAVTSGGQTEYDGAWNMEDVFDPQQGLRWTASTGADYTVTQISSHRTTYREATTSYVPLRLQEARAALFDPIPSARDVRRDAIRTSTSNWNGAAVACILLSGRGHDGTAIAGRRWEETEECIDPQTGLLQLHSQVPGRYYAYEYSNAPKLAGHTLPRSVTVTEGGAVVSQISVEAFDTLPSADPTLFVPTAAMKQSGRAVAMSGAQKISRVYGRGRFSPDAVAQPVCVFGLVTPSGKLVEAHSLQPADPNSKAAVEAAQQMKFSDTAPPSQHFVFVIEKFVSSQ